MPARVYRDQLHDLYCTFNRREFVHPDPLEFLYDYEELRDREIVGLLASSLAYGNVRQILKSVRSVLKRLHSPYSFLMDASRASLLKNLEDFKYRFTTGVELATMLYGVKRVIENHGSLHACFSSSLGDDHETVIPALSAFVRELSAVFECRPRSLLPLPEAGSACKRLNLFLRWMVRLDAVDPGGWEDVPASKLIVPLDRHMHRISLRLGLTTRRQADLRAACEITSAFRAIDPDDPVRYDFCLTRLGIRDDADPEGFIDLCTRTSGGVTGPLTSPHRG
jgi:uncharacterized protein (TIGR02757 family)